MKKQDVQVGASYIAKVSGKLAEIRITGESRHGGWDAVNVATKKSVRIKSAQRLRAAAGKPKAKGQAKADAPAAPAPGDNPLVTAEASEFTELLGKASIDQLQAALSWGSLPAKKRSRIEAALKTRTTPRPADDIAKTVAAVEKGNLADGVEVPMPPKTRKARAPRADGKMSGLDAAAKVLAESREPLNAKQIVEQAAAKGYWTSPGGKTPHATIYAAMIVEIAKKGDQARFKKVERGLFTATEAAKQVK
ncbi:MAG: hypothetical protein BIFFINMI_02815 [Phycisphaerae bacterium]|nr:hypothetical protein [Phycisphaerae bacterium]